MWLSKIPILKIVEVPNASASSSRRDLFAKGAASLAAAAGLTSAVSSPANAYTVPDLLYPFDALEPSIDTPTMKIHHDKHHATYVANLNKALEGKDQPPIVDLMANAMEAGTAVRNNGGGHYNHAFFWDELTSAENSKKTKVSDKLAAAIDKAFGSMDEMKKQFEARAAPGALFGSGWVWVVSDDNGDLKIVGTPNQDNPLMKGALDKVYYPILALDVWEHAYYLKYQNRRPEYVTAWWNVVDWNKVSDNYEVVLKTHAGVPVRG